MINDTVVSKAAPQKMWATSSILVDYHEPVCKKKRTETDIEPHSTNCTLIIIIQIEIKRIILLLSDSPIIRNRRKSTKTIFPLLIFKSSLAYLITNNLYIKKST